jgi:hypothetical protein
MRFEKDKYFVEISDAISTDIDGPVWFIESNISFDILPIEFRKQVPRDDKEGFVKLKNAVSKWADREGFKLGL